MEEGHAVGWVRIYPEFQSDEGTKVRREVREVITHHA